MKKILRFFKLQKYVLFRIRDFPESVAIGMAWGASVSVTPALILSAYDRLCIEITA